MRRVFFPRLAWSAAPAAALLYLVAGTANAATQARTTPANLFVQAEIDKTADHARFLRTLKRLHQREHQLSPVQHWHLRYLDAWQDAFRGDRAEATPILHAIIDHSGNSSLETRASALLISILSLGRHYESAYKLANKLVSRLPAITDRRARAEALHYLIQMLNFAGQYDQALQYSHQLERENLSARGRCKADSYELNVLFVAGRLTSSDTRLNRATDLCLAVGETVYANTLRLDKADLLRTEGHVPQAIALLHRITPDIRSTEYQPHIASLHVTLAQAYLNKGDDARARKAALAALAMNLHKGYTWPSQTAYYVLYKVEKKAGDAAAALSYYEKYVTLNDASMDDSRARALAYQMVKQEVVSRKLRLETLTKKNRILQLHQDLEHKAAETSRLYVALLLMLVVLIGLWLYRIKHSQIRFRRMARHDGLTGSFNRQHFFDEAERVLRRLRKGGNDACLILLDLDHFKRINDTYGHAAGDEVLKHAVLVCRGELRTSDVLGRLGGEEFGILMPECSRRQGVEIGHRIRSALANTPITLATGETVRVSASFGLACTDASGHDVSQLFTGADAALYSAKRGGRNQLIVGEGEDPGNGDANGPGVSRPLTE